MKVINGAERQPWRSNMDDPESQRQNIQLASLNVKMIDVVRMKRPSFLMVLTAVGDYAYQRRDGVYVVPIGCLRN